MKKDLRFAVIGTGFWANYQIPAWQELEGVELVALYDRTKAKAEGLAWQPAQLAETAGPDTWRQWKFEWPPTPGSHTITVRATDANGMLQTADVAPPAPDGRLIPPAASAPPTTRSDPGRRVLGIR